MKKRRRLIITLLVLACLYSVGSYFTGAWLGIPNVVARARADENNWIVCDVQRNWGLNHLHDSSGDNWDWWLDWSSFERGHWKHRKLWVGAGNFGPGVQQ